jgi:hypothetical protein
MSGTTFTYEGPPAVITELEREVSSGDTFVVDEAIAPKLLLVSGFREAKTSETRKPKAETEETE